MAVGMVEHAHGHEVERLLTIRFLLLQDFLFRHRYLFLFYYRPPYGGITSRLRG